MIVEFKEELFKDPVKEEKLFKTILKFEYSIINNFPYPFLSGAIIIVKIVDGNTRRTFHITSFFF
jgi:hypothetical protein